MKILHAGNMVNIGYLTCKLLRESGIEVDLLLDTNNESPEKYNPELLNGYPSWFIQYHLNTSLWKLKILKTMRSKKYDLIHAYVELPIFSYLSRRPYIVQALGSDFRELAQSNTFSGLLLRRAYRKAKIILFSMPDHLPIYEKMNLKNGIFFPLPVNSLFFKPSKNKKILFNKKLVIFHPTSLIWRIKSNDILINGFSKFVKNNNDCLLIIVDRGEDSQKTHELIKKLNLENHVKFIKGPLTTEQLLEYYNAVDIVVDGFKLPAMSGITNESLCCEKPVIAYYPESEFKNVYPEHPPVRNAHTPDEICLELEFLCDSKKRCEVGKKGREWILKYNNSKHYPLKLKIIYESILNDISVDDIRKKIYNYSLNTK